MKKLFIILFCLISVYTKASTYYVALSGNDSNNGLSTSTPWKTIAKVNSLSLVPDDIVRFNGGDIFIGNLIITHSGTIGHPIIFNSYGTGNAIISGVTNVTAWTNLGSNIWESTSAVSTLSTCNVVSINGINTAMGKSPNSGFYIYQSFSGSTSITSSSLNSSVINWTGAQAVIRKERYVFTKPTIISSSGSTINFANDGFNGRANWGFFIQNDIRTLDQQNEWYYNPTTHKIDIYSASIPTNVQVASVSDLVTATNVSYITFDGITFTGANAEAFNTGNFANCKIQNCSFDLNYQSFQGANLGGSSANLLINNNTFNHTNNDCIDFKSEFTSPTITHNSIKNTATFEGMMAAGQSGWGMNITSSNALIQYNEVDTSGYIAIGFNCTSSAPMTVKNNYVNYFCYLKDDGGGIYSGNAQVSQLIDSNIVINGIGNNAGANATSLLASGIYCDDNSSGFTIRNNSGGNISYSGLYLHNANNCTVTNNTFYACGLGEFISNDNSATFTTNIYSHQNKIVAQTTGVTFSPQDQRTIDCATAHTTGTDIRNFGDIDSNYYARPINDNLTIRYTIYGVADADANLAMWQTYSAFDTHSHKSPASITNVNQLFFAYNPNNYDSTISIPNGTWVDVTGTPYNTGSTILHAYSSIALISTGTNIPPIANAGTNVNITLPTNSFTQAGSGTDTDGSIVAYNWTQISGANTATIGSPNSATTLISGLIQGNYVFQLRVTDNLGATAIDTMSAVVNSSPPPNQPPVVNAGGNKIITLPTSSVTQSGSATDPDGTIAGYQWTAAPTNPTTATIASPTNPVTLISGMTVAGVYRFILTVTDNLGATGTQSITVTVNAITPVPPTAHAGVDQSITWPANSITLSGTATAGTGTIASYHWVDISGDASIITNPNSASTTVTNFNIGTFKFELTVTDNSGFQGKDTMQVVVSKGTASLSYTVTSVTFNNTPQQIGILTSPAGLATSTTYNGVGQIPTNAGSYATVSNITDLAHYNSTAISGTFTINKATTTITVSNTTQTYTGSQLPVTVTTNPNVSGISVTYNGSATVPTNAGSYTVVASLSNINYTATPVTTTLVINKATPTVTWSTPTAITYGTALSGTQLNASASVAGTFTYTPASGAILNAGTNILSVDFTPTDATNYNSVNNTTVSLVINKATATISLSNLNQTFDGNPKPVTVATSPVGLTVITTTYNGSTTVPSAVGSYPINSSLNNSNYTATPATGTLVIGTSAANIFITNYANLVYTGSQQVPTVTCAYSYAITYNGSSTAPTNVGSYTTIATINDGIHTGADTVTMTIIKATPVITWPNPSAITYGTALSGTQLNASSTVSGSFVYTPISGTVLNAGTYVLSTSFTPTDASNYNTATATVNITVNKASATLSLSNLNQVYDGTPKPVTVTSTPSNLSGITVTYNGSSSIPTNAGSYPIVVTLSNVNYTASNVTGTLVVAKASSILSWATPTAVQQGTALSSTQLNATSTGSGTFTYSPTFGYIVQNNITLNATFTPTDTVNYNTQTISVFLSVYGNPVQKYYIRHGKTIYLNYPNQ